MTRELAEITMNKMCCANEVFPPEIQWFPGRTLSTLNKYGTYDRLLKRITVNVDRCHDEQHGLPQDTSIAGVVAHELGHHFNLMLGWGDIRRRMHHVHNVERPLSTYASVKGPHEDFAEAFRLFVTNPDLLRLIRPERYGWLTSDLNMKPIETRTWKEVLHGRPGMIQELLSEYYALT